MRTYGNQLAQHHGMTLAQLMILERLEHESDISQNELAAVKELSPMTVARLVDRLEGARSGQALRRSRRPSHVAFAIDACRCAAGAGNQGVASKALPCRGQKGSMRALLAR
jgi:hypothetical protein